MSGAIRPGRRRPRLSLDLAIVGFGLAAPVTVAADALVVLNKSDHEAALVDPVSLAVTAKIATGQGPHEVATGTVDGRRRAFVANYGFFAIFREGERPRMEAGNTISVIDLDTRAVVDTFDLGERTRPHGIVLSRDGRRLWVTCEGAKAVVELDAVSGKVLAEWNTAQDVSHMIVPTPDEKKLYVANIGSGSVTVIERAGGKVTSIPTGEGAEGIDVSPDGAEVWITNRGANTISILRVADDAITDTLDSRGTMPIRVKFTPDGREAWVSNARSNTVCVFDARERTHLATIEVGAVPVGIQMAPDGRRAFVANTNDHKITVLDVPGRKVAGTFTTGNEPDGMAWATGGTPKKP